MASSLLEIDSALQDRIVKTVTVPLRVKVVGNATPALKVVSSDLPSVALIVTAGQAAAPAGVTTVSPVDATGLYSVVLDAAAVGKVLKVLKVDVINVTGTHTAAISLSGGSVVIDIDSSADLTSANSEVQLIIHYSKK